MSRDHHTVPGARAALSLAIVAALAGCGDGDASGPDEGDVVGGAQAASAPPATAATAPVAASPDAADSSTGSPALLFDDVFDASLADLATVAEVLRERVLRAGASALVSLNRDYAGGTLGEDALGCVSGDWPTLGYFCGEGLQGEPLATDVVPIGSFAYGDTAACVADLSENLDAPACVAQYVEARLDDASSVRYRLRFVAGDVVETLEASLGAESLVGPDLDDSLCVVDFRAGAVAAYSDEAVCDERIRAALRAN